MPPETPPAPSFREALRYWARLGFINFGGPAGQIAMMHRDLVERRRWISEERFLHALNFCMLLPGPEAQQLATYVGWLLHGTPGGLVAGRLFVLPSVFMLLGLSCIYAALRRACAPSAAVLAGFKAVVVAIVVEAVVADRTAGASRPGARRDRGGGLPRDLPLRRAVPADRARRRERSGSLVPGLRPAGSAARRRGSTPSRDRDRLLAAALAARPRPDSRSGSLPLAPLLASARAGQPARSGVHVLHAGRARDLRRRVRRARLRDAGRRPAPSAGSRHAQAVDGLALAETTPGPLIMVLQFVGFLAAWRHPEGMTPPRQRHARRRSSRRRRRSCPASSSSSSARPTSRFCAATAKLSAALSAITAAVVGVILNLALVFGAAALFPGGFPPVATRSRSPSAASRSSRCSSSAWIFCGSSRRAPPRVSFDSRSAETFRRRRLFARRARPSSVHAAFTRSPLLLPS